MKKTMYSELSYVIGLVLLALGTALMEMANFGMSMVVAPAYILSLVVEKFTFGMAEYVLQAFLLVLLSLVIRKFKINFLFSFATALIYGFTLDLFMGLVALAPVSGMLFRGLYFFVGLALCSFGVAMLFHTYIAPEAYELFVKEFSQTYHTDIAKTKTVYDCVSCVVSILMSFIFFGFGHFEGVKYGTVFCALVNGYLIGLCSSFLEKTFVFKDGLKLRKYFEN